jgi:cysteinyl-tRNA synthetase
MDTGEFLEGNLDGAKQLLARFDLLFDVLQTSAAEGAISDTEVEALIAERVQAKKSRNFARADEIRNSLSERGVILEDTKEGSRWKRK